MDNLYRAIDQCGQVINVWLSRRRDLTAAQTFFTQALATGSVPVEVITDRAPAYPRVLDELIPAALHTTDQYANNRVEADHDRLKARLRPMRDLKRYRQLAHSPPVTPSCRTCAAATTPSRPIRPNDTAFAPPSTS
jgi:IS6 family transposase